MWVWAEGGARHQPLLLHHRDTDTCTAASIITDTGCFKTSGRCDAVVMQMTDISALQILGMQEISSSAAGEIRNHSESFLISCMWRGTVNHKWWYKRSLNNNDWLSDIWHWEKNYDNVKVEQWARCWPRQSCGEDTATTGIEKFLCPGRSAAASQLPGRRTQLKWET